MPMLLETTEDSSEKQEWMHSLVKTLQLTNSKQTKCPGQPTEVEHKKCHPTKRSVWLKGRERLKALCGCQFLLSIDFQGQPFNWDSTALLTNLKDLSHRRVMLSHRMLND